MQISNILYFCRKKQVAKFLINNGADVTLSAKNGITAFDMASFIGKSNNLSIIICSEITF